MMKRLIHCAQAGDLSQSPAQENVQGSQEPPAAAAAEPPAPEGGAASPPQPEKPLSDITATADSPHRGKVLLILDHPDRKRCLHHWCSRFPAKVVLRHEGAAQIAAAS